MSFYILSKLYSPFVNTFFPLLGDKNIFLILLSSYTYKNILYFVVYLTMIVRPILAIYKLTKPEVTTFWWSHRRRPVTTYFMILLPEFSLYEFNSKLKGWPTCNCLCEGCGVIWDHARSRDTVHYLLSLAFFSVSLRIQRALWNY